MHESAYAFMQAGRAILSRFPGSGDISGGLPVDLRGDVAADRIKALIAGDEPFLIGRLGSNELETVLRSLSIRDRRSGPVRAIGFLTGKRPPFWFDERFRWRMHTQAGFFPADKENLLAFADRILNDLEAVDLLGSWLPGEERLAAYLAHAQTMPLATLEPYLQTSPWSESLSGKRVLVVHPFADTIRSQYKKREVLFADPRVLPPFELVTIKAVQSMAGSKTRFSSWFEALAWMEAEVRSVDFDVAIVGAGAYGLPLSATIKREGGKVIHLGGATQLLFGIRGKRWDHASAFLDLYNEHWVRPAQSEIPPGYMDVESGCYW